MSAVVWVPRDAAARAVGADEVAAALAAAGFTVRRNGSRGAAWLETLVEVETPAGRVGYGPVAPEDAPGLLAALPGGGAHPLRIGDPAAHPWFARQTRLTFARLGLHDPLDLDAYAASGGWAGLRRTLAFGGAALVEEIAASGLRGRGGAAFPAGIKWRTVAGAVADRKYVVCNADEGDSGTFADRLVMEGDPYLLIEGMAIAGLSVGADTGYVYVRSEYPDAEAALREAVRRAEAAGFLGDDVAGGGRAFRLEVRRGAGAYICGEETAMLESLEGKRGMVRAKPPIPALSGLFGKPTLVHNVLSLAAVPDIAARGGAWYASHGAGRSTGTLGFQLAGNVLRGGLVELPFGATLRDLVEGFGGGTASGRPIKAVQVGGPLGPWLPASRLDTPLAYEPMAAAGGMLGHGGVVVVDDTANLADFARHALAFCAEESCGKCTPCRIGSVRGVEVLDRLRAGDRRQEALLRDLCDTMEHGSLCAMGGMTPFPVRSALDHFRDDFGTASVR